MSEQVKIKVFIKDKNNTVPVFEVIVLREGRTNKEISEEWRIRLSRRNEYCCVDSSDISFGVSTQDVLAWTVVDA